MKRTKLVHDNPNGLFMQWLTEFRDEAKDKGNSGLIKIYNMCIENLSKYDNVLIILKCIVIYEVN